MPIEVYFPNEKFELEEGYTSVQVPYSFCAVMNSKRDSTNPDGVPTYGINISIVGMNEANKYIKYVDIPIEKSISYGPLAGKLNAGIEFTGDLSKIKLSLILT